MTAEPLFRVPFKLYAEAARHDRWRFDASVLATAIQSAVQIPVESACLSANEVALYEWQSDE